MLFSALLLPLTAQAEDCFHPDRNKIIEKYFKPNHLQTLLLTPKADETTLDKVESKLNEDASVMEKIHAKIRDGSLKNNIDPRVVYSLMIGLSQANPFFSPPMIEGSKAAQTYGLFAFQKEELDAVKKQCDKARHPRLCQVEYYMDVFVPERIELMPAACNEKNKKWKDLSAAQKMSFLDQGSCNPEASEKNDWLTKRNYQNSGANTLLTQIVDWRSPNDRKKDEIPLCEDYVQPGQDSKAPSVKPKNPTET